MSRGYNSHTIGANKMKEYLYKQRRGVGKMKCTTIIDDCGCNTCQKAKREAIESSRKGMINAQTTFGPVKFGIPTRTLIIPAVTDREPPDITKENWVFMTGTLWRNPHIHNDRCATKCAERKKGCKCEN